MIGHSPESVIEEPIDSLDRIRTLTDARRFAERTVVLSALQEVGGSFDKAAQILQCSRVTVYDLVKKHDLQQIALQIQSDAHVKGKGYRPRDTSLLDGASD